MFTYFHFSHLKVSNLSLISHANRMFVEKVYPLWLKQFARHIRLAYIAQFDAHVRYIEQGFRQEFDLHPYDNPPEYDYWESYCSAMGLYEHQQQMERSESIIISELPYSFSGTQEADPYENIANWIAGQAVNAGALFPEFWRVWFDQETQQGNQDQTKLRRLNYPHYLKSTYWRRVRAAMLIASRLRCQSIECVGMDNYHGDEDLLHVHHMHYRNKGRESITNLRVLCSRCHQRYHAGDTSHIDEWEAGYRAFAFLDPADQGGAP